MTATDELLPCPFCGGNAQIVTDSIRIDGHVFHVDYHITHHCQAVGFMCTRSYENIDTAILVWNRRAR